jgi:hypothetical protein
MSRAPAAGKRVSTRLRSINRIKSEAAEEYARLERRQAKCGNEDRNTRFALFSQRLRLNNLSKLARMRPKQPMFRALD